MTSEVTTSGPFFDERWDAAMSSLRHDIADAVGDRALADWREALDGSVRVNKGEYVAHTQVAREDYSAVVSDGGSVYGPWLEGTGSRNSPNTRFPGYASARRASQRTQERASTTAAPAVDKFAARVNE